MLTFTVNASTLDAQHNQTPKVFNATDVIVAYCVFSRIVNLDVSGKKLFSIGP